MDTTEKFSEQLPDRGLTIRRLPDEGLEVTIDTKHGLEMVPLTEERARDLARWLGQEDRDREYATAYLAGGKGVVGCHAKILGCGEAELIDRIRALQTEAASALAERDAAERVRDEAILDAGKCLADDRETIATLKERCRLLLDFKNMWRGRAVKAEQKVQNLSRSFVVAAKDGIDQRRKRADPAALPEGARTETDDGVEWVVLTGDRPPDNRWVRASTVSPSVAFVRNRDGETNPITRRVAETVLAVLSKAEGPAPAEVLPTWIDRAPTDQHLQRSPTRDSLSAGHIALGIHVVDPSRSDS